MAAAAKPGSAAVVGAPAAGLPAKPASAAPAAPPKAAAAAAQPAPAPAAKVRERRRDAGMCSGCGMGFVMGSVRGGPVRARRLAFFSCPAIVQHSIAVGLQAEKKEKAAAAGPASKGAAAAEPGVDALDIRVGQIVKVGPHPNAESLYVEEIDVGEEKPRQVSRSDKSHAHADPS